jgi:hypothetical protein
VVAGLGAAVGGGHGIASATPSESGDAGNAPAASSPDRPGHGGALKKSVVRQRLGKRGIVADAADKQEPRTSHSLSAVDHPSAKISHPARVVLRAASAEADTVKSAISDLKVQFKPAVVPVQREVRARPQALSSAQQSATAPVTVRSIVTDVLSWTGLDRPNASGSFPDAPLDTVVASLWQAVRDARNKQTGQTSPAAVAADPPTDPEIGLEDL